MTIGALITEAIICKKTANKLYRISLRYTS
jgi:hypothetical protein